MPTRAFHWLLVLSLCGSWATAEAGLDWADTHNLFGYFALGLVTFRILWGLFGTRYARFAHFITGPRRVMRSARGLFNRAPSHALGHTPIGGWSILLCLVLVAIQALSGLFISDDIFHAGPYNAAISSHLAGRLAYVHNLNFMALQAFAVVHVAAIAWYHFGKRSPLVGAMWHGRKPLDPTTTASAPTAAAGITSSLGIRALVLILLCVLVVTAVVQFAPEPALGDFNF